LAKVKLSEIGISADLCHLILHDHAARPRRQRDHDPRTYPVRRIDSLAGHRAIAAGTLAPARRISMPHHVKTQALRDTGVSQVTPDFRYLPGRQDELPGPVSHGAVADNADPVPHTPIVAWIPAPYRVDFRSAGCTPATSYAALMSSSQYHLAGCERDGGQIGKTGSRCAGPGIAADPHGAALCEPAAITSSGVASDSGRAHVITASASRRCPRRGRGAKCPVTAVARLRRPGFRPVPGAGRHPPAATGDGAWPAVPSRAPRGTGGRGTAWRSACGAWSPPSARRRRLRLPPRARRRNTRLR
jgi:hypothetical protein